jgi:hypothetical protein
MTASCSHSCCRQDFLPLACGLLPAEGREVACETPAAAALRGCGCVAQATALDLTGVGSSAGMVLSANTFGPLFHRSSATLRNVRRYQQKDFQMGIR